MLHAIYNISDVGMLYGAFREPLCRVTTSGGSAEQALPPPAPVSTRKKIMTSSSFTSNEVIASFWTLFTRLCAVGLALSVTVMKQQDTCQTQRSSPASASAN